MPSKNKKMPLPAEAGNPRPVPPGGATMMASTLPVSGADSLEADAKAQERLAEMTLMNLRLHQELAELTENEKYIRIIQAVLSYFALAKNQQDYLARISEIIKDVCHCQCVGIRLAGRQRQMPYAAYQGFNQEFWQSENHLSLEHDNCICTRITLGTPTERESNLVTKFGSFYCPDLPEFLADLSESEKPHYRLECQKQGFKTMVIIPIRRQAAMLGAVHLTDSKVNAVSLKNVEMIESLIPLLGEGIAKFNLLDEILETNELLERIFASANTAIAYLDREFNFIRVNWAFAHWEGKTPEYFVGKNHFTLYPDPENLKIFESVLASGEPYVACSKTVVYSLHPERGARYWDWNVQPVKNDSGKTEGLILFMVDVTQRNRAEQELLETQHQLAEARRLSDIGTLAATVAHELRNPLAAIHMAAYNIRRKTQTDILDKHLNTIEKKVGESDQIINNLLFYSRLRIPQFENLALLQELRECIKDSSDRYQKEAITVEETLDALQGIVLPADRLQLREVFNNVLNNAYDAMHGRGGTLKITAQQHAAAIRLEFADTGCGIAAENLEKVFDPFFTTKAKGTGLGLTVCKQILHLHGGSIELSSSRTLGATVRIALPLPGVRP